ncbi:MAG TPA: glutaredoxin family protein [Rubrivivax sp.]
MKRIALMGAMLLTSLPSWALYKVVGPDGKITYTDRAPIDASSKVTGLGRDSVRSVPAEADTGPTLPLELRQVMAKFPVTLYTAPDCAPCDGARQLLQQRGVPYTEKRVLNEADAVAFEAAVGGRTIPGATIGSQPLRGFAAGDWSVYLDAAGYPRESRLPRNWRAPVPTPVVARAPVAAEPVAAPPAEAATPPRTAARPEVPPAAGTLRF